MQEWTKRKTRCGAGRGGAFVGVEAGAGGEETIQCKRKAEGGRRTRDAAVVLRRGRGKCNGDGRSVCLALGLACSEAGVCAEQQVRVCL